MASYTPPTAQEVIDASGLATYLELDTEEITVNLQQDSIILTAEAESAVAVGESAFDSSSLTARQALLLKEAVKRRAARNILVGPMLRKLLGTHEPLLTEDSEEFEARMASLLEEAERYESLVTAGTEPQAGQPYAKPAFGSGTFTRTDSDRTPSERNMLLDERDDVAADDTDNG